MTPYGIENPIDSRYSAVASTQNTIARTGQMHAIRGHDQSTEQDVFIKFRDRQNDPNAELRVLREAEVLDSLDHPQIPKLLHADPEAEAPYIVTELKAGDSKLTEGFTHNPNHLFAAELCLEALKPLAHVHDKFVHRDIKPANLRMQWAGAVALVDFDISVSKNAKLAWDGKEDGIPASEKRMTMQGHVWGTAEYMAPEQMLGKHAALDTRSDLYSAGVVLYQFLYGKVPLSGTLAAIKKRQDQNSISFDDPNHRGVPADLLAVAEKALQISAHQRYMSAEAMIEDLERYLHGKPARRADKLPIAA